MFSVYLRLGFEHLLDLQGYDHILFLVVLCAPFSLAEWRRLLVLVTAFTAGHTVSLALATLGWIRVASIWVEFLIPLTIVAAAAINVRWALACGRAADAGGENPVRGPGVWHLQYLAALGFGVVHGLGFANFLRLVLGGEDRLFVPLLSFNIGLELAQIVAASLVLAVSLLATRVLRVPSKLWAAVLSALAGIVALAMAAQRWPF